MGELARDLIVATGFAADDFAKIVKTAPRRYKQFEIPKRNGKMREIAQPARELKVLQRALIEIVLSKLPVHECARAYRTGFSIRDNAKVHAGSTPILKMDFVDFFPSIRASDWRLYCLKNNILDENDLYITEQLLFRLKKKEVIPKLTIGAPSSPILSNILLYDFDKVIAAEAAKRGIAYSRYADDLTFSGQRAGMLADMVGEVRRAVGAIKSPKLKINRDKTKFITAAHRRTVTGVTLTNDGELSVGRERKRLIRAKVDHAAKNRLNEDQLAELAGELAFVNVVEPEFLERLAARYGDGVLRRVKASQK